VTPWRSRPVLPDRVLGPVAEEERGDPDVEDGDLAGALAGGAIDYVG